MPLGKYFVLKSKLCGQLLGIQGESDNEGTPAVMCQQNDGPYQAWYEDRATGTIRSKANDLCLAISGSENKIILKRYVPNDEKQQWKLDGELVRQEIQSKMVLDIAGARRTVGAELCSYYFHGGRHQLWEVQYQEARQFYIVSELNNKVLDVAWSSSEPGAKLHMWDLNGASGTPNQRWYEDQSGFLRSAFNDFAPDGSTGEATMQPFDPDNCFRCWVVSGNKIFLKHTPDQVLDILRRKTENGASVGAYRYNGGANQKWCLKFID